MRNRSNNLEKCRICTEGAESITEGAVSATGDMESPVGRTTGTSRDANTFTGVEVSGAKPEPPPTIVSTLYYGSVEISKTKRTSS